MPLYLIKSVIAEQYSGMNRDGAKALAPSTVELIRL